MSGHSKWSQIKRQKGVADAQRGQLFTKLSKEIIIAAKQGGPDPNANFRLRLAVQKARENNMPADNIDRAIKRAAGGGDGADLAEIMYEGFGPAGTAVLVEVATDNRNRIVAEVRNVFTRAGGTLGESGSVAWNFDARGVISVSPNGKDPDDIALCAIDAGAEDVQVGEDSIEIYTAPADLEKVKKALEDNAIKVESAEPARVPKTTVQLDEKAAVQMLRLVEKLEQLDDVQKVYFNAEFSDDVLASYTS
ncbi:MAG TPA: YebC/PmpR family DNA-binding transcriptional regulator [Dehalococcoidia bacterium]|nr:YebC/PmpR family DNA-binding transcriptional regulator [Dehalococcoidia bacterium]